MIRKLKNILQKDNCSLQFQSPDTFNSNEPPPPPPPQQQQTINNTNEMHNSSPVNFIKRKIKSSKSWVKMPTKNNSSKQQNTHDDCVYATVTAPELANHDFENFTRNFHNASSSLDYGFESRAPSLNFHSPVPSSILKLDNNNDIRTNRLHKHSTVDTRCRHNSNFRSSLRNYSNSCFGNACNKPTAITTTSETTEFKLDDCQNFFYFKVIQRLKKASINSPAHIPLICCHSFKSDMSKWTQVLRQFNLMGIIDDVCLVELNRGMPVSAMFYSVEMDMIYVRTADEKEGYVPRDSCRAVVAFENRIERDESEETGFVSINTNLNTLQSCFATSNDNNNYKPDDNDSIKYHSLSLHTDYENNDDGETNPYAAIPVGDFFCPVKIQNSNTRDTRDSGYRSDGEAMVNNYEVAEDCLETQSGQGKEARIGEERLENMHSRCRMPISISNSMSLAVMNGNKLSSFANPIYKSPSTINMESKWLALNSSKVNETQKFERNKARRSLDSNLILSSTHQHHHKSSFHAVEIDIDEADASSTNNYNRTLNLFKKKENQQQYPDLDINKIELDSITETYELPTKNMVAKGRKVWTIVSRYEAQNSQEMGVVPGMLVLIVREYKSWLYIKMIECNEIDARVQIYGFVPRSCAVDLQSGQQYKVRRSQITAL